VKDMYSSGNAYLEQFIHGRAEGPINFMSKK
jgi:ABC-type transporter Mla maintaining outer membrane lipid asymmetry ATPase subunit MlaF